MIRSCQTFKLGAGNVAYVVECLPSICEVWVLFSVLNQTGYSRVCLESGGRGSEVQSHPKLYF